MMQSYMAGLIMQPLANLQLATLDYQYILGRLPSVVPVCADFLHKIKALNHVAKDASKSAHLLQDDAELGCHHAQVVMALLGAPHADCAADCHQLSVVGQEERILENGTSAAAVVQFKVAGNHALTFPALKDRAALVTHSGLAGC